MTCVHTPAQCLFEDRHLGCRFSERRRTRDRVQSRTARTRSPTTAPTRLGCGTPSVPPSPLLFFPPRVVPFAVPLAAAGPEPTGPARHRQQLRRQSGTCQKHASPLLFEDGMTVPKGSRNSAGSGLSTRDLPPQRHSGSAMGACTRTDVIISIRSAAHIIASGLNPVDYK